MPILKGKLGGCIVMGIQFVEREGGGQPKPEKVHDNQTL